MILISSTGLSAACENFGESSDSAPREAPQASAVPENQKVAPAAPTADADLWYQGGNLHRAGAAAWSQATAANKLATCAEFIVGMKEAGMLKPEIDQQISNINDTKPFAQELVAALDEQFSAPQPPSSVRSASAPRPTPQPVGEDPAIQVALYPAARLGWLK